MTFADAICKIIKRCLKKPAQNSLFHDCKMQGQLQLIRNSHTGLAGTCFCGFRMQSCLVLPFFCVCLRSYPLGSIMIDSKTSSNHYAVALTNANLSDFRSAIILTKVCAIIRRMNHVQLCHASFYDIPRVPALHCQNRSSASASRFG